MYFVKKRVQSGEGVGGLVDVLACRRPAAGVRAGRRKEKKKKDIKKTPKRQHGFSRPPPPPERPTLDIVGVSSASCLCALQTLVVVRKQRNPLNVSIHSPRGGLRASGRQLSLDGCCWHFPQPCPPVCFCVRVCVCQPAPSLCSSCANACTPSPPSSFLNTLPHCAELQVQMSGLQSK